MLLNLKWNKEITGTCQAHRLPPSGRSLKRIIAEGEINVKYVLEEKI